MNLLCEVNGMTFTSDKAVMELFSGLDADNNMMLDYQEILFGMAQFYNNDPDT